MAESKKETGGAGAGGTGASGAGAVPVVSNTVPLLSPEIEIELGDERNRIFAWGPTMELLRGMWTRKNLHSDELVEELAAMPDIPGMRIRVSVERKLAILYDPLSHPDNKVLCDKISAIIFARFRKKEGPAATTERRDLDADDIKTWLYCMARRRDAGQCRVTVGDLPPTVAIERLPGRIRIEAYNSSARACKWKEDFNEHIDAILSRSLMQSAVS
jgi:hypothetical protein